MCRSTLFSQFIVQIAKAMATASRFDYSSFHIDFPITYSSAEASHFDNLSFHIKDGCHSQGFAASLHLRFWYSPNKYWCFGDHKHRRVCYIMSFEKYIAQHFERQRCATESRMQIRIFRCYLCWTTRISWEWPLPSIIVWWKWTFFKLQKSHRQKKVNPCDHPWDQVMIGHHHESTQINVECIS